MEVEDGAAPKCCVFPHRSRVFARVNAVNIHEEFGTNTDPLDDYGKHLGDHPDNNLRILTKSLEKLSEKPRGDYPVLNFLKEKFLTTTEADSIDRVHHVHMALAERLAEVPVAEFPALKENEELYNLYVEALDVYKTKILQLFSGLKNDHQKITSLYTSRGDQKYIYILLPQGPPVIRNEPIEFWIKNIVSFVRLRARGDIRSKIELALCSGPTDVFQNFKSLKKIVRPKAPFYGKLYHEVLTTFLENTTDEQTKSLFEFFLKTVEKVQLSSNPSPSTANSITVS
ncbi:hypothetical protein CROQUDRAFT_87405 [Cronartium quercuum f. sp. fusiforme G11]|uniref:Uncharacterized protein n=1 Tax=Cronartium quercuum f. sp. fusiforme G11 TaxID=708437 RepID=A0A9P6NV99_9BASI|nr:hypothetical protein CROQUDRAFT_87405 [Cronartium quercuum f. sp. fusiforme G11]